MKNKSLCIERDAGRCRTCGSQDDIDVVKLIKRKCEVSFHLSNLVTLCKQCIDEKNNVPDTSNRVGVILCGGKATRLYPITRTTNKHILPIGIVPMAFYGIKTLRKFGIKKVLVVIDQFSASIVETLGSGKMFGMDFSYKLQDGSFGIADALYLAKDFANFDDEIVCILGDNIFDNEIIDTDVDLEYYDKYDKYEGHSYWKGCIYLKKVSNPSDYGVAIISDDKMVDKIVEKPKEFISDKAVVGLYVYTYDVFDVIRSIKSSVRGELEISAVNDYYASQGRLLSKELNGYWGDAGGSVRRYAECNMYGAKQAKVSAEEIDNFRSIVFDDK